jgi:hypothetical protein
MLTSAKCRLYAKKSQLLGKTLDVSFQPHRLPLPAPTLVRSILFLQMSDSDYEKRASRCDNQDITVCALGSFR